MVVVLCILLMTSLGTLGAVVALTLWIRRRLRDIAEQTTVTGHWIRDVRAWQHLMDYRGSQTYLPWSSYAMGGEALVLVVNEIMRSGPGLVVELGSGISTLELARALRRRGRGHLVTFDHDAAWCELITRRAGEEGLSDLVTVVHAPLEDLELAGQNYRWYSPAAVERTIQNRPIDILLVDGPPGQTCRRARYPAIPVLGPSIGPGTVVFVDDAERTDEQSIIRDWSDASGRTSLITEGIHSIAAMRDPAAPPAAPSVLNFSLRKSAEGRR